MTLLDLFHALNQAGVGIVQADGKIQLRPASAVTPALRDAVLEHKTTLLSLLPDSSSMLTDELALERKAIESEPTLAGPATAPLLARAVAEWDLVLAEDAVRRAITERDAVGYSLDPALRQQQWLASDKIDDAWGSKDLSALLAAVSHFLGLLGQTPLRPNAVIVHTLESAFS